MSGSSPVTSQFATICGCLPTSDRPSSECDASSKNSSDSDLRGPRADGDVRAVHRDAVGMRDRARLEQPLQLDALPLAFAEQCDHVRHRMDAADQQFARDIDVGAVAQRARHDRLDHREDVLDSVVELVDDGGQPPLEADPYLDFAAEPQIVVGDITEQAADDAGERKPYGGHDDRRLLRARRGVGLGVVGERPVAAAERHRPHHRRRRLRLTGRRVTAPCSLATNSSLGSRGSFNTTENNDRSSFTSISGASS